MDKEQKQRLENLKKLSQLKMQEKKWEENELLQECLSALDLYSIINDKNEVEKIVNLASMPYAEMHSHAEQIYLDNNEQYFIVWDEATLPIVLCLGKSINECWDDVMAVAFDTYFVAESTKKVIGIRH